MANAYELIDDLSESIGLTVPPQAKSAAISIMTQSVWWIANGDDAEVGVGHLLLPAVRTSTRPAST